MRNLSLAALALFFVAPSYAGQSPASGGFAPLEKWRAAVRSGDSTALTQLYAESAQVSDTHGRPFNLGDDIAFWSAWKGKGLTNAKLEVDQEQNPQPNIHVVTMHVALALREGAASKTQFVLVSQGWTQQSGEWVIGTEQRTEPAGLRQPIGKKEVYPVKADAKEEIAKALRAAAPEHKRVLVVFGGNWCYDCLVLDKAFHSPEIAPMLGKNFEVVHIDIGEFDKNLDVAEKYDVPLKRGVPALAVLDYDGKVLFSQKRGEFEAARSMATDDILEFLNKWKPPATR
jgi:ketosteroid isomerase-like protein